MTDKVYTRCIYRHLVFLLLLRRKRKLRFLISNFKHSTGLFELALPDFVKATCSALLSPTLHSPLTVQAI
ncbi:hypothetical protein EI989_02985 [Streptococcus suis]|nr:hypothetical protein EI985_03105 [Streptococcus suis]RRR41499.1 hypothetical protein EI989_02985 [Streptococcus suis]RRR63828.1 hypothetical protein EI991_02840 [Streptococcus suis]